MSGTRGGGGGGVRLDRPLETKLGLVMTLSDDDRARLRSLSETELRFRRGAALLSEGAEQDAVYVLKAGWVGCARHLSDGRRQITRFALPGDVVGFDALVQHVSTQDASALSDVTVVVLRPAELIDLAASAPHLGMALLWATAKDESALAERLASIGRRFALERLAHLFVETRLRLEALGLAEEDRLHFPVTKEQLADAMGLTTIHIYRTLRRLTESGLVRLDGAWLEILDLEALKRLGKFDDLYIVPGRIPEASRRAVRRAKD
ncbi:MAG: Crp/Fnr family transcriptional regulator [Marivibrio sp.]|uniref:Crp/Fnr family transcriptional regulator n=1 Tax=Marivibrio sp. TaxID=2039719 RepID=UPI0032EB5873